MPKVNTVTSLEQAPQEERRSRFIIYTISMVIRFACVASVVFTTGIWQWICGIGAVFLPYFAVVIGNNVGPKKQQTAQAVKVEALKIDVAKHIKELE